jgi:uncharacterized protein with FMN-binding domain
MLPKRGIIALVSTALGLVLLLSFKTTPAPTFGRLTGSPGAVQASPVAPSQPAVGGQGDGGTAGSPAAPPSPAPSSTAAAGAAGSRNGTVTGQAVDTPYGAVQVQITLDAGRIADVQAVQLPNDRRRSAEISQYVAPILRSETLTAQSSSIDLISGATYTSEGYAESLQSALDQAHG